MGSLWPSSRKPDSCCSSFIGSPNLFFPAELFPAEVPADRFLPGVLDHLDDAARVYHGLLTHEYTREAAARVQLALLVECPHLMGELGLQQLGRKSAERGSDVVDVALEHGESGIVARGIDDLRQVDDDGPFRRKQYVEFREIAVDEAQAQHAHDLLHEKAVILARDIRSELHFAQPRRRVSRRIGDELHDQYIVEIAEGPRD